MAKTEKEQETVRTGRLYRAGRGVLRVTFTLGIVALAGLAVAFGSQHLAQRANSAPAPAPAPTMPVATAPVVLEPGYSVTRSFVGQIEPQRTAAMSFELSGRLDEVLVDEGEAVERGEHLATLDMRLLNAERDRLQASKAALEAQLRFARQSVERQSELSDRGFASQVALDEALARSDELTARIAEIDAGLMTNTIQAEKSKIYAPFPGRVTERLVDGGESIAPGQALIEIVEQKAPYLRVGVPLDVTHDDLREASADVDGRAYAATLVALRPDVDPVTRTRTAIFELAATEGVAFGQTAYLRLEDEIETEGLWMPVTALKEGLRGQWTLLAVDAENTVRTVSVQVLHGDGDKVFVRGAFPDGTKLIMSGPQRVTVGQTVDPQPAS